MKTTLISLALFRNLIMTLSIVLANSFCSYGQDNYNTSTSGTNNLRTSVNTIQGKVNQTYSYAEQASNTTTISEAQTAAKQILILLEEVKNITKNAQTVLDALSTLENKNKAGKYLNAIASDLVDLQNKTEGAIRNANRIASSNDFDDIKPSATAIITETKKINTILAENINHIALMDQRLTSVD